MKIAVVGATGLVGTEILKVLEEHQFPVTELIPVASEKSVGKQVFFGGKPFAVVTAEAAIAMKPEIAVFSAGGNTSLQLAPLFAEAGTVVIDNSSAWRMHPDKPLIVPEVNGSVLTKNDKIIANPNCSTIQMVLVLAPLHKKYKIKRIVVSTYQSVTGTGKAAVDQLMAERAGEADVKRVYPHKIDLNVLPHIDVFTENGYTKEEMKMINETKKILNNYDINVTATTVRIPVMGGHSESVNVEFENDFDLSEVKQILENTSGVIVQDEPEKNIYPMPMNAHGRDEVFVGRIRRDFSTKNALNMWIVADNLRKGAATNAVQIAEYLIKHDLV
jgi:aspartate-semialdehyde dehydrogenase